MKKYFSMLVALLIANFTFAQQHTYQKDANKKRTCYDDYYEAYISRGALPVPDGEQKVVFSMRKDTTCFCGEGKVTVKDGKITPFMYVKKEDGTYEAAKKKLHPNTTRSESNQPSTFTIYKGMSSTFLTDDYYIVNLFFVDYLKRKVVPNSVAPHPDSLSGVQIVLTEKEKEIIKQAYEGLQFANGKSEIKSTSFPHLNLLASMLTDKPEYKLELNGYTDNVGKPESNLTLSRKRADAVKNYLIKKGIEEGRITSQGFGVENPIADNTTADGRAKNRRVEFIIVK